MANRKRRVPEAVREQLERKRQQASTFAERQGAALGREAREQLKPLLKQSPANPAAKPAQPLRITVDMSAAFDAAMRTMTTRMLGNWHGFTLESAPIAPSVDPAKLEALKSAEPRKLAPRAPDLVEVITGWRGWTLSRCGRLEALGKDTVWPAKRALEAECQRGGTMSRYVGSVSHHLAPAWDCTCGVWAFKDLDRLVAALGSQYSGVRVIGTVSLWGRVIETENGYRAQYAYPAELWLLDDTLEELGRVYDVPVRSAG